jgi:hypothetical protein
MAVSKAKKSTRFITCNLLDGLNAKATSSGLCGPAFAILFPGCLHRESAFIHIAVILASDCRA